MPALKFNPQDLSIILDVEISGKASTITRLVLDTGASFVVLPWKLAVAIGLQIDPEKTIQTTTATTLETVPKVIIPEISVLGKKVRMVEAIIKDLPPEAPVDGLLGLSFLKNFKLTIDFSKGELILE